MLVIIIEYDVHVREISLLMSLFVKRLSVLSWPCFQQALVSVVSIFKGVFFFYDSNGNLIKRVSH